MAKAEFLQLAHVYDSKKHFAAGKFLSEKLDGQRCFWDGGVSRGIPAAEVPWANTERDARLKRPSIATGLWSRYGNVIHAPDAWLEHLPAIPLDGELYLGRGRFQELRSIVGDHVAGPAWIGVKFMVFDSPPAGIVFGDRDINITNFKKKLWACYHWWDAKGRADTVLSNIVFADRLKFAARYLFGSRRAELHEQVRLPMNEAEAQAVINDRLEAVTSRGGEGLILKSPFSLYKCERTYDLLKVKKLQDAEGVVVGYVAGALPDNTRTVNGDASGKLLGKLGSLIVRVMGPKGLRDFNLSGFTDAERELTRQATSFALANPGAQISPYDDGPCPAFPLHSQVTFRFREWSDDGYPKEARYWRKHA